MGAWLVAVHLGLAPAAAGDPPTLLEWNAPAECPDQSRVDARLQQLVPGERAQSLRARAEVTAIAGGWRLQVELSSATGTSVRELEAQSCAVLLEAAVFIVAVAIDPAIASMAMRDDALQAVEVEPPALVPVVPAEPESEPEPEAPREEADAQPERFVAPELRSGPRAIDRRRIGGALRAALAVGTAEVSRFDLAPSLTGAIRGRYWRAELGLRYVAGRTQPIEGPADAELRLDAAGAVARGCGVAPAGPVEIPVCAGIDLAAVRGRPSGLVAPRDRIALRAAVDVAVAVAWPLTRRVALWLEAAGGFALLRPKFVARDQQIHLGAPASFAALLGIELRFGQGPPSR